MTPVASVLLPIHNCAPWLDDCLRSIARQSEERLDVVIIDDGSTDESASIARAWAGDDRRFRLFSRRREGLVEALNFGIRRVRADVVVRMDGDDIMHRHRVKLQLETLEDDALDGVGCRVRLFPRPIATEGLARYERWLNAIHTPEDVVRNRFIECPIAHPTFAIRRETLREFRYRDVGWAEDYDLVLRMLSAGRKLAVVPTRLLGWRDHVDRLSRNDQRYAIEQFTACRAHHLAQSYLHGASYVLWGFGHTGKALRRALAQHGKVLRAIVDVHPGRRGQRIHGAPVIPPHALPQHRGTPTLISVANTAARAEIRQAMASMHFAEERDYVFCA